EPSRRLTVVTSVSDQLSTGPTGVLLQSNFRTSSAISPRPIIREDDAEAAVGVLRDFLRLDDDDMVKPEPRTFGLPERTETPHDRPDIVSMAVLLKYIECHSIQWAARIVSATRAASTAAFTSCVRRTCAPLRIKIVWAARFP